MPLKPNNLTMPWKVISGGQTEALIVAVKDTPAYVDGKATDTIIGKTYTAILPSNGWEKIQVKVESQDEIITEEMLQKSTPIKAEFIGMNAKWYYNSRISDYALTCKAASIILTTSKK